MVPFSQYADRVEAHLGHSYGISVVTKDVPDPLTGDLDGLEIQIDHAVTPEERLFLLAHLFGHTVQWNVNPRALEIGSLHQPPVPEGLLSDIVAYEREAASYALAMLHEAGITDADQWLSDYTACDMAYLEHYYRTGEKRTFAAFRRAGSPLIQAQGIPSFVPVRRRFRCDGIVI